MPDSLLLMIQKEVKLSIADERTNNLNKNEKWKTKYFLGGFSGFWYNNEFIIKKLIFCGYINWKKIKISAFIHCYFETFWKMKSDCYLLI